METYILDNEKSTITWTGTNENLTTHGEIKEINGKLFSRFGRIVDGFVEINLNNLLLSDDTKLDKENEEKLIKHLKSSEFLDTKNFPKAEYLIDKVVNENGNSFVRGQLILKDEAYGLNVPVKLSVNKKSVKVEGGFQLPYYNKQIKDTITEGYNGQPIESIKLDFKLIADISTL